MNILYIGSSGALSLVLFRKLLSSQYNVVAVGVDNPMVINTKIIALKNASLALAASQEAIPVIDLSAPMDHILRQITDLSISLVLIACYGKRLPARIIKQLDNACFNLHPSLLPGYRGPEPIFWQMKQAAQMGVSWHWLSEDFDAGDIALQKKLPMEDGLSYAAINQQLAEAGASLMIKLLADYASANLSASVQNTQQVSYYSYPQKQDFRVNPEWTARHAYNFMCATHKFGQPYACYVNGHSYQLSRAVSYEAADGATQTAINTTTNSVNINQKLISIPCKEGGLIATLYW